MALYLSGSQLANVELSDTFNVWRLRTNQVLSDASSLSGNNTFSGTQTFTDTVFVNSNVTANGTTFTSTANAVFSGANTDISGYLKMTNTGQIRLPVGDTSQRIEGTVGALRYNSETSQFEGYGAEGWGQIGGGGLGKFEFISTTYTAAAGDRIAADTSSSAFTITLPAAPSEDDIVEIIDQEGSFATNNLTIDRNGSTIEGLTENLLADVSGANFYLQYNGSTWVVFGVSGGTTSVAGLILSETVENDADSEQTSSTSQTAISTFSATTYEGAKYIIQADDTVTSEKYITELLVTHNGTTAVSTEYGQVATDAALATYDVDISGGNVRILATPASSNLTTFKTFKQLILA